MQIRIKLSLPEASHAGVIDNSVVLSGMYRKESVKGVGNQMTESFYIFAKPFLMQELMRAGWITTRGP